MDFSNFAQVIISGLIVGSVYSVIAIGFVVVYKSTAVFNFAVGPLVVLGSLICWSFVGVFNFPFWLGFLLTLATTLGAGFAIERFFLRPLIGQPILALVMMTLALFILLQNIATLIWGNRSYSYPAFFGIEPIRFANIIISKPYLAALLIALLIFGLLAWYFKFTRGGLALRAVAEDTQAAQGTGINIKRIYGWSWAICALACSLAGILLGNILTAGVLLTEHGLKAMPVVLVGGLESLLGALVAGPLIGVIESLSAEYISPRMGAAFEDVAAFVVLLLILIVKPYGLFGEKRIERV